MMAYGVVNDTSTRERLSKHAIQGYLKIAAIWGLRSDEQIDMLGASLTRNTLANWATGATKAVLSADQLMRVSLLVGIYEGLQRIWRQAPQEADAWPRRPRADGPFRGASPLEFMRQGGIPALVETRAYVDGITGGPPSRADYVQPPREGI
jgi:hypothetical protein